MLGVFLIGMLTRSRGSDLGNAIAISIGLATTIYLGGLHVDFGNLIGVKLPPPPIKVAFTWFALIGAMTVFIIGVLFSTPPQVIDEAHRKAEQAHEGEDVPLALRGEKGFDVVQR
jgi:hypothetical protein